MPQTIDFEWLVEGEIRSIPTSASTRWRLGVRELRKREG